MDATTIRATRHNVQAGTRIRHYRSGATATVRHVYGTGAILVTFDDERDSCLLSLVWATFELIP